MRDTARGQTARSDAPGAACPLLDIGGQLLDTYELTAYSTSTCANAQLTMASAPMAGATLKDLNVEDKAKVAKLVQKVRAV